MLADKRRRMKLVYRIAATALLAVAASLAAAAEIAPDEAAKHMGETATICGVLESRATPSDRRNSQLS
jgi:hypothetical protein